MTSRQISWLLLSLLCGIAIVVLLLLSARKEELQVSFLDVGQGDAILIEGPTGVDVLIDGGKDRSVLRELPRKMGVLDRTIDVVIATHPDADHIGGLPEVFARYKVRHYIEPGVRHVTNQSDALEAAVEAEGSERTTARRGLRLSLGGGAYADILYPDRDVTGVESNTGSIILRVVYGDTEFLLTGDAPSSVEEWLVALDGAKLQSEVLKAGHHGSNTSTSDALLAAVKPSVVVVSAGKDNSYGHPHEEVLARVRASGAHLLSTIESGTMEFVSDGSTIREK